MKRNLRSRKLGLVAAALVAVAGVGAAGLASAGGVSATRVAPEENEAAEESSEAAMLLAVRIPLADAVRTAEQRTGMRAAEAELSDEAKTPAWEISVGSGAQEQTVMVDATSGQVSSVAADDGDAKEGNDAD